jgi:aminoglycoside phosphotransferase (APT) family kinase protein
MKGVWDKTRTRELPAIESQYHRLVELQPPQRHTGIVHSDYRLGNVMLDAGGKVTAVLDWELCALGDVMVDLAFLINSWDGPEDPSPGAWMQDAPTRSGGFPGRDAIATRYAQSSGVEVSNLDYYRAFCYWRIAIIGEGIKRRYQSGALASDIDPQFVETRIQCRIDMAEEFLARARNG